MRTLSALKVLIKWVILHRFYKYDERAYRFLLENRVMTKFELWVVKLVGKVNGYN